MKFFYPNLAKTSFSDTSCIGTFKLYPIILKEVIALKIKNKVAFKIIHYDIILPQYAINLKDSQHYRYCNIQNAVSYKNDSKLKR